MSLDVYLGIDVGSVTTKLALVDEKGKYVDSYMLKTAGKPVDAVQNGMKQIISQALCDYSVRGVGTTGSGRNLAGALVGADVVKNEITAHAVAASPFDDDKKNAIRNRVADKLQKDVRVQWHVDSDIIGGLIFNINQTIVDNSIRHKLEDLKGQMALRR